MEIKTYDKILFLLGGILIGTLFILTLYSDFFYRTPYSLAFKINGYTKENALAFCSGKSLKSTCYCLNSFVRGIYKYDKTKDSTYLSFEKLVERGGDCKDYTNLYIELFEKLGFKTERESIFIEERDKYSTHHAFVIVYNEEGYCKLDMRDIDIFMYEKWIKKYI